MPYNPITDDYGRMLNGSEADRIAEELAGAKENVLKSFAAFMAAAGDDLRKLIEAENDASLHNPRQDHVLFDIMHQHDLWSPVNDWAELVVLEYAEDYVAAVDPVPHAIAAE